MQLRHLGVALLWALLPAATIDQPFAAKHARVELVSEQNAIAPGSGFLLGVHFILEPGWHIYWVNPGDSGQPPVFKWQLPPGFKAGEIRWPRPERMQSSSTLADYGYHDDVLLMAPVYAPAAISSASPIEFVVEAKWLICREVCLPDHAQLSLSLPVGSVAKANPRTAIMFAGVQKLLPKPLPSGWNATAESRKDDFVLSVFAGKALAKAEFFPLDPALVDNAAPQKLESAPQGVKIVLKKSDLLVKPVAVLRGVLVVAGGDAYHVEARVSRKD